MADPTIGLRISGTKQRQAGFVPLVTCGILAGDEGKNMDRVTMVAEKPVYIIKHAPDYILYQLIDRQVKSFDADASGVLSIAMTIPSNMQLAQGKSPYRLLRDIYEKFQETCMERLSDGRDSFKNMDNDSDIFREIVGCYSLEERRTGYVVMNPQGLTGITCVSLDDLEAFFKNTQYKEFASFKDIEVGINCKDMVSAGLDKLQIPLPLVSYEVWVNNVQTGKLMQSLSDSYFVSAKSSVFHAYEGVEFTLREVLEAQGDLEKNNAHIRLDYKTNRIYCDLRKIDIFYELKFDWKDNTGQGKDVILSAIKNSKIKVQLGMRDISKLFFEEAPRVTAVDIINKDVTFNPSVISDYILQGQVALDDVFHKAVIQIIVNRRKTFQPAVTSVRNKESNRTGRELHEEGKDMQRNSYVLPQTPRKKGFKSFLTGFIFGAIIGVAATLLLIGNVNNTEGKGDTDSTATRIVNYQTTEKNSEDNKNKEAAKIVDDLINDIGDVDLSSIEKIKAAEEAYNNLNDDQKRFVDNLEKLNDAYSRYNNLKAEADKNAAQEEIKKARKTIVTLVNQKKNLDQIKGDAAWKKADLTENEENAIDAVVRLTQYPEGSVKKSRVKSLLKDKTFNSLKEIENIKIIIDAIQDDAI